MRNTEKLAQSIIWQVLRICTLPKLLGVPELCLLPFCSLTVRLIWQDMKINGIDARRWPGLALWVPTARSCDVHYTYNLPGIKESLRER